MFHSNIIFVTCLYSRICATAILQIPVTSTHSRIRRKLICIHFVVETNGIPNFLAKPLVYLVVRRRASPEAHTVYRGGDGSGRSNVTNSAIGDNRIYDSVISASIVSATPLRPRTTTVFLRGIRNRSITLRLLISP